MRRNDIQNSWTRAASVLTLAILLGGCAWFQRPEQHPELAGRGASGRDLYVQACASCHGAGAKGKGPVATALVVPPPDLTQIAAGSGGSFNSARIREVVDGRVMFAAHGTREMPVWGYLFSEQRKRGEGREAISRERSRRIVAYLESIQVR